jgi:hypothetical membrane protein
MISINCAEFGPQGAEVATVLGGCCAIMTFMAPDALSTPRLLRASLAAAVCMPICYYATQLAACPFYPAYSFRNQIASELGSGGSQQPWIFNVGIGITGALAIAASYGLYKSFRRQNGIVLSRLIAFAVAYTGFVSIKAGVFPLPDARHSSHGFIFTLLTPPLMFLAAQRSSRPRGLQLYFLLSSLLLIPVVLLLYGLISIPWLGIGTVQRLLALGTYVPVGVAGVSFLREQALDSVSL